MKAFTEKLTAKQEQAIVALLSHSTLTEAAKACGLSEVTLWRYMQLESFMVRYREARRQTVERTIGRLQAMMDAAVGTLERNLNCENPAVEIRAAQLIFEQGIRGVEIIELQERIERLEQMIEEKEKVKKWG